MRDTENYAKGFEMMRMLVYATFISVVLGAVIVQQKMERKLAQMQLDYSMQACETCVHYLRTNTHLLEKALVALK